MYEFTSPSTVQDALEMWHERAQWYAGGTDLITQIKSDLASPARLIDLKKVEQLRAIQDDRDEMILGPLVTLAEIASNPEIREGYRALAEACEQAASPQIRNVGTIGGNLAQASRCPYYRGPFECWLKGGEICFMREGENREASITGYSECVHVHPSDPIQALIAFDAKIVVRAEHSIREIPAAQVIRAPAGSDRRINALEPGEMILEIRLPRFRRSPSVYVKAMDRAAWAFALVSVAVRLELQDRHVTAARIILGGIAPAPFRARAAESALEFHPLTDERIARAAEEALPRVEPLEHNRYKVHLARGLIKRALERIVQMQYGSR